MFTAIPNLTSTAAFPCIPWDFKGGGMPAGAVSDKALRTKFLQNPELKWEIYSAFEGVNSRLRLKAPGAGDEEGNPPASMAGVVADYDLRLTEPEVRLAISRMSPKPNWWEVSLSGNSRLVWVFEKPILLPSHAFAVHLLSKISDFIPVLQMAGLDVPALRACEKYYTNSGNWTLIHPEPVSEALVNGFLVSLADKFDWASEGPEVPLDVVAAELKKNHPSFRWPGKFELGSAGPSWFVTGSQSPLSAIIRPTGMSTFSAHAQKSFFSWQELLGADFVQQFKTKQMGDAVKDCYFDEKSYFSRLASGEWAVDNKDDFRLYLKVTKGLSDRVKKGSHSSECDEALAYVHRNHRVKTCASFCFYPEGILNFNGTSVLNTHTRKALQPAPGSVVWGPEGSFPWLSNFLGTLFCPREQLDFFLSWCAHFYRSCYDRRPRSGTALFIAGGVNTGKTLLSRAIISQLVGGFAEANDYLMGTDNFSQEMFDAAAWVVDDGSMSIDARSHKKFSEQVKRATANPQARCNGKFLKAVTILWQGRVIVTMNTDSESLRLLPDLDISVREKVMILRTVSEAAVKFLPQSEMNDMLARELPHLARFLLDYSYPPHTLSPDPRFHVFPYAEESLVSSANHSSVSGAFSEILSEFLEEYFEREKDKDFWSGTALQLFKQMLSDPAMAEVLRKYDSLVIGRQLSTLSGKKVFDIEISSADSNRRFTISRGSRFPKKLNGHRVPQSENSKFQKQI